jgi:hypothetical protein
MASFCPRDQESIILPRAYPNAYYWKYINVFCKWDNDTPETLDQVSQDLRKGFVELYIKLKVRMKNPSCT